MAEKQSRMTLRLRVCALGLLVAIGCSNRTQRSEASSVSQATTDFRAQMKEFGVKQARIELHFTFFLGPRFPRPVRSMYFTDYGLYATQVTDPQILTEIKNSGLEAKLKGEALAHAKGGAWLDLPSLLPFPAAAQVTVFDDAARASKPGMYTVDDPNRTPLQQAIFSNDEADVLRLLSSGKISTKELNDGLFWACGPDSPQILQALLRSGADVNAVYDHGKGHITPLMVAVRWRNKEGVETLVKAGAKAGARDEYGETELTTVLNDTQDVREIVGLLLESGVDVNAANIYGLTGLMRASRAQPGPVLELLIKHGADVNAKDRQGRTALSFASENGNDAAAKALVESGARP
jgi:Ankyrin repeats (3 copies)/Ankyrin repeat